MRGKTLWIWMLAATIGLGLLATYDIWRDPTSTYFAGNGTRAWPSFALSFCAALGMFIINQLLEHKERNHALFAHYQEHFEDGWMRGFQLVISLGFTVIFWGVLLLGAELFNLIHLSWLKDLLEKNWFRCPALGMAFAAAVHLTDVRPATLRGMRNVGLTLLSWLLSLMILLDSGFLIALLFTGLQPLWETRHAATILLWAAAILTLFLNAKYKDDDPDVLPPLVLRSSARAAGPIILLLTIIAGYAVALRIGQYGMSVERVVSIAIVCVAMLYGAGYRAASVRNAPWMKRLEQVKVATSIVILVVLVALLTPIADPARLSVNSQMARLANGKTKPDKFDYQFLRFGSGGYGAAALAQLTHDANADVKARAFRAQKITDRNSLNNEVNPEATEAAFSHATLYPAGVQLTDDFRKQDWKKEANSTDIPNPRASMPSSRRGGQLHGRGIIKYPIKLIFYACCSRGWFDKRRLEEL